MPLAPRFITIVIACVAENPVPWIVNVAACWDRSVVEATTVGTTLAMILAGEVVKPNSVTVAVNDPKPVGCTVMVTVSWVEVAAVTVPAAPRLKVTTLSDGLVEKSVPVMRMVVCVAHT